MNSINSKNLREFLYVCITKSLNAAAKGLYMTPQGLGKTIKNMENELGVKLFVRDNTGMHLTPAGKILREKAVHIIDELDSIKEDILTESAEVSRKSAKTIKLELTFGTVKYFTLQDMSDFELSHPNISISMNEGTDDQIISHICSKERDIGFCVGPVDTTLFDAIYIYSRKHCLVVNRKNKLSNREKISWKDLKGESLIFESQEFSAYNNNLNRALKAGFEPKIVFCAGDVTYAHELAENNIGIAISVDDMCSQSMLKNSVKIPFSDEDCMMDIYMIIKKDREKRPEIEEFITYIEEWLKTKNNEE